MTNDQFYGKEINRQMSVFTLFPHFSFLIFLLEVKPEQGQLENYSDKSRLMVNKAFPVLSYSFRDPLGGQRESGIPSVGVFFYHS